MDSVGRITAIILAVILIFLFPLQYIAVSQGEIIDDIVHSHASEFTDTARHQGYISLDMYEDLIYNLDQTGEFYDVTIDASHPITGKDLAEKTNRKDKAEGKILNVSYLKTQELGEINIMAAHIHTTDCYNGDLHNHSGSSSYGGGCYTSPYYHYHSGSSIYGGGCYTSPNYHSHTSTCYQSDWCGKSTSSWVYTTNGVWCSKCKKNTDMNYYKKSCGISGHEGNAGMANSCGHYSNIADSICYGTVTTLICSLSTTSPVSYSIGCGKSTSTVEGYSLGCGKSSGYYYNSNGQQVSPTCHLVVTSITPTNPSQTMIQGGTIVTTAMATYLDGHTGTVNCTASGFNTNTIGIQTVTLTYSGTVGNAKTNGTRTCTMSVTVNAANYPTSLNVTPSSTTVYNGVEPSYTVEVVYKDGTKKNITSGYAKTGWSTGAGTKNVTFSFTEGATTVTKMVAITVLPNVTSLNVTPSSTTVFNGKEPTYTVVLTYENGTNKTISSGYTKSGWSSGPGTKTVTFSYTENGRTVTKSISIIVLPNLTSITVTPSSQSVARYSYPVITVRAYYENNTNKVISSGYTVTGLNVSQLGNQTVTVSYTENSITKTVTFTVTVQKMKVTCPICRTEYEVNNSNVDTGCPVCSVSPISISATPPNITLNKGVALSVTVTASFKNGKTSVVSGWTSDYNPYTIGIKEVKITYMGVSTYINVNTIDAKKTCLICGQVYHLEEDGTDSGCPYCSKEAISISVLEDHVTIEKHSQLPIRVTATFRDGHTEIITAWSSNLVPDTEGTFNITIYYQSARDTVLVTVIGEGLIHCPYCGLDYYAYANPDGCPVCSTTIVAIEASLRNGGTKVLYKSQLNLKIILLYRDTHRMQTYKDYIVSGYQADVIGVQTITVHYGGHSTQLIIEVVDGPYKVVCPNGHEYQLNEDGSDPGCPFCDDATEGDKAIFYFDTTFTSDIIAILYADGIFYMEDGDYLTVTVTKREVSIRSNLKNMFFGTNRGIGKREYIFGGEVY